jgi:hypothetical protein
MAERYSEGNSSMFPEDGGDDSMGYSSMDNPTDISTDTPTDALMEDDGGGSEEKDKGGKTLTDFIFRKLESFGYPGRRLEEFKKKFIKENISPDGTKDIKVEIPDKYYPNEMGDIKTIETEELSSLVSEMGDKFGLNFNGAERSEGKWVINLTSAKKGKNPEDEMAPDNLEEVYGPANSNGNLKKKKVNAFSLNEMIKGYKDDNLMEKLKKIIGDNNAS